MIETSAFQLVQLLLLSRLRPLLLLCSRDFVYCYYHADETSSIVIIVQLDDRDWTPRLRHCLFIHGAIDAD